MDFHHVIRLVVYLIDPHSECYRRYNYLNRTLQPFFVHERTSIGSKICMIRASLDVCNDLFLRGKLQTTVFDYILPLVISSPAKSSASLIENV